MRPEWRSNWLFWPYIIALNAARIVSSQPVLKPEPKMEKITGRIEEMKLLKDALVSKDAGLVAVYGRRRVGKTFLIHSYFQAHLAFELTGMYKGSLKKQLE